MMELKDPGKLNHVCDICKINSGYHTMKTRPPRSRWGKAVCGDTDLPGIRSRKGSSDRALR
ncbi:MAG TPA: hypothetical protein PLN60_11100, partial [Bacillota bacterium]|nr:hypothetical protein [Bacillota bacterium]